MSLNTAVHLQKKVARRFVLVVEENIDYYYYFEGLEGLDQFGSHAKDFLCVVVTTLKIQAVKYH